MIVPDMLIIYNFKRYWCRNQCRLVAKEWNFKTQFTRTLLCLFQVPNSAPPPPPVRNTSIRPGLSSAYTEIESRFCEYFHLVHEFPTPLPFQGVCKVYNSRAGKLLLQLQFDYLFSLIPSSASPSTKCRLCYNFLPS